MQSGPRYKGMQVFHDQYNKHWQNIQSAIYVTIDKITTRTTDYNVDINIKQFFVINITTFLLQNMTIYIFHVQ